MLLVAPLERLDHMPEVGGQARPDFRADRLGDAAMKGLGDAAGNAGQGIAVAAQRYGVADLSS